MKTPYTTEVPRAPSAVRKLVELQQRALSLRARLEGAKLISFVELQVLREIEIEAKQLGAKVVEEMEKKT